MGNFPNPPSHLLFFFPNVPNTSFATLPPTHFLFPVCPLRGSKMEKCSHSTTPVHPPKMSGDKTLFVKSLKRVALYDSRIYRPLYNWLNREHRLQTSFLKPKFRFTHTLYGTQFGLMLISPNG